MEIRILQTQNDEERWNGFAGQHHSCTPFHRLEWKRAIEKTYGHKAYYLFAENGHDVVGIMPIFLMRDVLWRKTLVSLPFAPYGGICSSDPSATECLLSRAQALMADLGASCLEMRCYAANSAMAELPVNCQYVSAVYKTLGGSDEAWKRLNKNRRKKVRKAQNCGLSAEVLDPGDSTNAFYSVYARRMRDLGTPAHAPDFFRHVADEFSNSAKILLVRREGKVIAATFLLLHNSILICGWGAAAKEYLQCEPNDLLYWETIRYACEQGIGKVDFGRSLAGSGNAAFKREWGATEAVLDYRCILKGRSNVPNVSPSNPNYDRLSRLWRCLPLTVTNRLGPIIRKRVA